MKKKVYDTRFFIEYFYSTDRELLLKMKKDLRETREKYVPTVVIHEVYVLTLKKEGREVAKLRAEVLKRDFKVIGLDAELAVISAELRHKYRIPLADSIIAATALKLKAVVVSDDEHFKRIKEIKTTWY